MSNSAGAKSLAHYKALSFDVFGTILDWERGFYPHLKLIADRLPEGHPCRAPYVTSDEPLAPKHPLFVGFDKHEAKIMAELPKINYFTALSYAYRDLCTELGVSVPDEDIQRAARSCATWPPFPDTVDAMRRLGQHYKLIALSNVSNEGIQGVLSLPFKDVKFDAVYTAENIGSYKPAIDNFEYLLDGVKREFGVERDQLLHVAHGITSDQKPAEALGIDHVWVERGSDNGKEQMAGMKRLRLVRNMEQFADQAGEAFASKVE